MEVHVHGHGLSLSSMEDVLHTFRSQMLFGTGVAGESMYMSGMIQTYIKPCIKLGDQHDIRKIRYDDDISIRCIINL